MTPLEWTLCVALLCVGVLATMGSVAAYRNGVTDGYGCSREPTCPGYKAAGEYLKKTMAHRWPELRPDRPLPQLPKGGSASAPPKGKEWQGTRDAPEPLPTKFAAHVDDWFGVNKLRPDQVRWSVFPLGMVRTWIDRAQRAETKLSNGKPEEAQP